VPVSLEPTNEQAIALALATGLGETRGMHVAMLLWPLVRDMVLEEAAKACDTPTKQENYILARGVIRDRIIAMKGKP
jgi:hypothetical protein